MRFLCRSRQEAGSEAAVGSLLGAIAVVATVLYLAMQVRHGTRASRAESINQLNSQFRDIMFELARSGDLAKAHRLAASDQEVDEDTSIRYRAYLSGLFAFFEEAYLVHQSGSYSEDLGGQDLVDFMAPMIRRFLAGQLAKRWWREESANLYVADFRGRVEAVADLASSC